MRQGEKTTDSPLPDLHFILALSWDMINRVLDPLCENKNNTCPHCPCRHIKALASVVMFTFVQTDPPDEMCFYLTFNVQCFEHLFHPGCKFNSKF